MRLPRLSDHLALVLFTRTASARNLPGRAKLQIRGVETLLDLRVSVLLPSRLEIFFFPVASCLSNACRSM